MIGDGPMPMSMARAYLCVGDAVGPLGIGATPIPEAPLQDPLADVFPGTEDAPLPIGRRDAGGHVHLWHANPADPRWAVDATFRRDGSLLAVHSVRPRP